MELWPRGLLCRVGSDCEVNVLPSILVTPNMGCEMYGTDNLDYAHILYPHLSICSHWEWMLVLLLAECKVYPFPKHLFVFLGLVIVTFNFCVNDCDQVVTIALF